MTLQLYSSLLHVCSTEPSGGTRVRPLSELTAAAHLHGLVVLRIHGRRVPAMGYFGPDDVCVDTWLPELLDARTALSRDGGTHVLDEGEQGQPAFRFARRGENLVFTIGPSLLSEGEGFPEWDGIECPYASFETAVSSFATRVRNELRSNAPETADGWWSSRVGVRPVPDSPVTKPVLVIDGSRFDDFYGFVAEASEQIVPAVTWGGNLDAFNDILRGGFGTPDGGFVLEWRDASRSRRHLGYGETARRWDEVAARCHPSNVTNIRERAEAARGQEGATLFDDIVAIIRDHGEGGSESEDGVELRLID